MEIRQGYDLDKTVAQSVRPVVMGSLVWLTTAVLAGAADIDQEVITKLTNAYNRGMAFYKEERYAEATPEFELAVRMAPLVYGRGDKGPQNINTARLTEFLANCYSETFRLNEAEELYRQCAETARREEGPNSPMYFRCQGNLALVAFRLNQWEQAEKLFLTSLQHRQPLEDWAVRANNLAYLYMTINRHQAAEEWFKKSLEVWAERDTDQARLMTAQCRHGLGMVAYKQHRYAEAQRLFEQALEERQRLLPRDSRWVAQSQGMLASVLASLGQDALALRFAEQAEKAYRDRWGGTHIDVGLQLHEVGLLLARRGDLSRAVAKLDESRRIYRRYIGGILTGLAQPEQLRFLAEERNRFMDVIALARNHPNDERLVRASLEWTLNEKGIMQETLAERFLQARDAHLQPELASILTELEQVRQRLAAMAAAGDVKTELWNDLTAQERELERRLARASRRRTASGWVELDRIAAALPDESVLVQIVRIDRAAPAVSFFGARPNKEPYYVAWTLRKRDGQVRLFDLGEAQPIEDQVVAVRKLLGKEGWKLIKNRGELEAEQSVNEQLYALSSKVFEPLLSTLQDARRIVISPDGALWLIPWAALPVEEGRYAVEDYEISYVISGREMLTAAAPSKGQAVIMADPDYDLSPSKAQSALQAIYRSTAIPSVPKVRPVTSWDELPKMERLPETAAEAQMITPSLTQYVGKEPFVYLDQYALEGMFRRLRQPAVLVLSTHGILLEDAPDHDSSLPKQDPLLRCGLLLAGCNVREQGKPNDGEDGVLTGLEIIGADLRGTELVVLSACETGLGQVQNSEGVAGLRQAFQLSGAHTVVATLWQIPDGESAKLMNAFFGNLAQGQAKAEALAKAQRARIRHRRNRDGVAHPIFWAAYTVTGR